MIPSYMQVVQRGDETTYRYNPPSDAVEAGVVKREQLGTDLSTASAYVKEQNILLNEWRREKRYLKNLSAKSTVDDLIKSYINSQTFLSLGDKTRQDYVYYMNSWKKSRLGSVPLPKSKIGTIVTPMCQRIYEEHADRSISMASHTLAVYRLLFNYAIRHGFTNHNPFSKVQTRKHKSRKIVWERHHVRAFLNTAFSKFQWRNVGVIVNMAYEWGQRLGDMRELTWDSYNLDTGVLTLTQSKRGANIQVPTSEGLRKMLAQQHEDFCWQPYIAPSHRVIRGVAKPYTLMSLNRMGNVIMKEAQLPDELMLMDLRRTAISEMVEVGVPMSSIMAVSGHATPMSLSPYIKHTLRGATNAQQMRGLPEYLI